jgi:hypothetical protein
VSDGQPVEPGEELPLLVRLGRARKPTGATGKRRDGTTVNIWKSLGMRDPGEDDRPREDQVPWYPWPP